MLTQAQIDLLKPVVQADPTASALALAADDVGLAAWLNGASAKTVWRTDVPMRDIFNSIVWSNTTPSMVPDGTTLWTNRNLQCQSKQLELQTLIFGSEGHVDASKANIRQGFQDALTAIPSKADGSNQAAGWLVVQEAFKRIATAAEAALSSGAGTNADPATMTFEGLVSYSEASMIRS